MGNRSASLPIIKQSLMEFILADAMIVKRSASVVFGISLVLEMNQCRGASGGLLQVDRFVSRTPSVSS